MAELKEEHFLRIDENKDRILQSEKKKITTSSLRFRNDVA